MATLQCRVLLHVTFLASAAGVVQAQDARLPRLPVAFSPRGESGVVLEGLLRPAAGLALQPGVVICHPDPRYGGSMDVPVVVALEQALADAGFVTLVFNLRGVGKSTGEFSGGPGEVRDCLGALDFLRSRPDVDARRVCLVAYSFGAWVGLQACVRDVGEPAADGSACSVTACVCLALPIASDEDPARHPYFAQISFPTLFLSGSADEISSVRAIRGLVRVCDRGRYCLVHTLPGADHYLWDRDMLAEAVRLTAGYLLRRCVRAGGKVSSQSRN